jgi:hypothetical protein
VCTCRSMTSFMSLSKETQWRMLVNAIKYGVEAMILLLEALGGDVLVHA